jgi:hypothetical protein
MKTHVIQLEQYDDLISVRDKMSWAKAPRILLVWPPRRSIKISPLDMVLLQRHAIYLGAQLGIATRSGYVHHAAIDYGIPVFRSSKEAQSESWSVKPRKPNLRRRKRKRNLRAFHKELLESMRFQEPGGLNKPIIRIGIFISGVLAILVLLAFLLPSAIIRLNPITQVQSVQIPIIIDPKSNKQSKTGVIPAYLVSISLEGNDEAQATGKMVLPEARAAGIVRFTNLTPLPVSIPEGTIIHTVDSPNLSFFVSKAGEAAGGVGATLDLPIRAVEGGLAGNLPEDSLQVLEGSLGLSLAVTNPEATTGGSDGEKTVANSEDRSKLSLKVQDSLIQLARVTIAQQIPKGGSLIPGTLKGETISEIFSPPESTPGPRLSLKLIQNYQAYYVSEDDLKSLGNQVLDASISEGYIPIPGSLTVTPIGEPEITSDGNLIWQVRADRNNAARIDLFDVLPRVLGKTPATAKKNMEELSIMSAPEITLSPAWWFWLPSLPLKIAIETNPQ